ARQRAATFERRRARWASWRQWRLRTWLLAGGLVVLLAGAGLTRWLVTAERPVPPDAARWFQRGTETLREGAFHSAAVALEEGIRQFPTYPAAYARLAEARAE